MTIDFKLVLVMGKINFAEQFEKNWCPYSFNNCSGLILIAYVPLTPGIYQTFIPTYTNLQLSPEGLF